MKKFPLFLVSIFMIACTSNEKHTFDNNTEVQLLTSDTLLQQIFNKAEKMAEGNITYFGNKKILIEGAQYRNIWLETQPMGGYMYAKRDLDIAKNNMEIFIDHQRPDGRFPGVIYKRIDKIEPNYCHFQGLCFPMPAYELYFLLGKDKKYLQKVYNSLKKFDDYLWKTRDSDNNGCLETWCIFDTGEDHCIRFNEFPNAWSFDFPPTKEAVLKLSKQELKINCKESEYDSLVEMTVPIESMDIMSYSYSCRDVLSLISKELEIGKEEYWRKKANAIRSKIKSYLWNANKYACFDKDNNNNTMPILLHNNLRCMYYGSFDQEMADEFIRYHLLNPKEFWTPMPLPSIAANDPSFRNIPGNNWSGQPQGLTFQRSIRALENYGHYSELTMIGSKFLKVIGDSLKFTQQFDPFRATINNSKDGYGPSILASLEFISRLYGIHITKDNIYWSCLDSNHTYMYSQKWNNSIFEINANNDTVNCFIDDKNVFSFTKGIRVVSNINGNLIEIVGIAEEPKPAKIEYNGLCYSLIVKPNSIYRLNDNGVFFEFKSIEISNKNES